MECKTCIYYEHDAVDIGECRYNPPVVTGINPETNQTESRFPLVCIFEWCGKYVATKEHKNDLHKSRKDGTLPNIE